MPTPAAMHLLEKGPFDCAIIVSASHNPWVDNGIKIIDRTGKLSLEDEKLITQLFEEHTTIEDSYDTFGAEYPFSQAADLYLQSVLQHFKTDFLSGYKIILDVAHGATYKTAPALFKALGAEVHTLNNTPNGININERCGALHPEGLQEAVRMLEADIGFAFDGDGDRVIAVSRQGLLKDGDDLLVFLMEHPAYRQQPAIVGTAMSNEGLASFLQSKGKRLIRTAVGDKYVQERLVEESLMLGGEPSGHIILRDLLLSGDGVLVALRVMEAMQETNNVDLVTFAKLPQVLINLPVAHKKDLSEGLLGELITAAQAQMSPGRVLVRFSGTEPLLRIMVEAASNDDATRIAYSLRRQLQQQFNA